MTFFAVDRHGLHVVAPADATCPEGQDGWSDAWCHAPVPWRPRPPLAEVIRNRLRALGCWLVFAVLRLVRGRSPFGKAISRPQVGYRGAWSRRVPMMFGGAADAGASCCCCGPNDQPLRRLARYVPSPDGSTRVRVRRGGWVAQSRHEPELYGPVAEGWGSRA